MGSHLGPDWNKWPELALVGQMAGSGRQLVRSRRSWAWLTSLGFLVQGPEVEGWREPQGGGVAGPSC